MLAISICALPTLSMASGQDQISQDVAAFNAPLIQDAVIEKYASMARKFLNSVDEYSNTDTKAQVGTLSSASPLYYLEVYAAISSNYPSYEYFSQSQYYSVQDHGGAEMYIVTVELGYGFSPIAKMIGNNLTQVQQQAITDNGIVIGYFRWWDASGYQNGQFTYQNTSSNYPYNTMSDWINIR